MAEAIGSRGDRAIGCRGAEAQGGGESPFVPEGAPYRPVSNIQPITREALKAEVLRLIGEDVEVQQAINGALMRIQSLRHGPRSW
jgi:hypothetical protein